jgi:hypothetical protein
MMLPRLHQARLTLRRTERGVVMACEFRLEPGSGWVFVASEQEKFLLASTKRDNSEVGNINFMKSHEMILRNEK